MCDAHLPSEYPRSEPHTDSHEHPAAPPTKTFWYGPPDNRTLVTLIAGPNAQFTCPFDGCGKTLKQTSSMQYHLDHIHIPKGSIRASKRGYAQAAIQGPVPDPDPIPKRPRHQHARTVPGMPPPPAPNHPIELETAIRLPDHPMELDTAVHEPEPDHQPPNSAEPVVHNHQLLSSHGLFVMQPFGLIICVLCGYGVLGKHIRGHLEEHHSDRTLKKEEVDDIIHRFQLADSREEIPFPSQPIQAIEGLNTLPGLVCSVPGCRLMTISQKAVSPHLTQHRSSEAAEFRPCMMQTLMPKEVRGYIEVFPQDVPQAPVTRASDAIERAMQEDKATFMPPMASPPDPRTVHPFLHMSGWQGYIHGWDPRHILKLQALAKPTAAMTQDCLEILQLLSQHCHPDDYTPRCWINSPLRFVSTHLSHHLSPSAADPDPLQ